MKINFQTLNPHINKFGLAANPLKTYGSTTFMGGISDSDSFESESAEKEYLDWLYEKYSGKTMRPHDFYSGKLYKEMLEKRPSIAFIYNPKLTLAERQKLLDESETIFNTAGIAKKMGLEHFKFKAWRENENLIFAKNEYVSRSYDQDAFFLDIEIPQNKAFLEYLKSVLPHSIPGENLIKDYGFGQDTVTRFVKKGELRPVGFNDIPKANCGAYNLLFDMEDEVNKRTFERHLRTITLPSKKYGEGRNRFVPVNYLQKLGYGDGKTLYNLVKCGKLPGKIQQAGEGKLRVYVDIGAKGAQLKLSNLRYQNPDVISIEEFTRVMCLKKTVVEEALANGEIEIIGEYIFQDDYKERYINRNTEKNQSFCDRILFERQLARHLSAQKRAETRKERITRIKSPIEALRRTLVWSMCPYTKMVAGEVAKNDGYAAKILLKIAEEGMKSLNRNEMIKYKSYCKTFWAMAGTEEYSAAYKKAKVIIEQLKQGGIDAVEDPEARKIIEDFLKEYKDIQAF